MEEGCVEGLKKQAELIECQLPRGASSDTLHYPIVIEAEKKHDNVNLQHRT